MAAYYLNETSHHFADCQCPHCQQGLEVEFIDDPCEGSDIMTCPKCSNKIEIKTEITITYSASKIN